MSVNLCYVDTQGDAMLRTAGLSPQGFYITKGYETYMAIIINLSLGERDRLDLERLVAEEDRA